MVSMTTGLTLGLLELNGQPLSLEQIGQVASGSMDAAIAPAARQRIAASQAVVDRIVASNETAYGINTGFGKLSDVRIGPGDLQQLQRNLVRSHASGLGEPLEEAEVRAMLLLRANVLAKGLSGVRYELIELLVALLNHRVHPVIPAKGSVGASGDLAPLAHLALVLIGEGEAFFQGAGCRPGGACESRPHPLGARSQGRPGAAQRNPGHGRGGRSGSAARDPGEPALRSGRRHGARGFARHAGGLR